MSDENKINNQDNDLELDEQSIDNVDNDFENDKDNKTKKKKSFKTKVIMVETIILIIVLAAAFLYFNTQAEKRQEISDSYEKLEIINQELNECENLITQDQVNPDEYNYCRLLLRKFK
jgi:flagellar basal body-associated protein FliL